MRENEYKKLWENEKKKKVEMRKWVKIKKMRKWQNDTIYDEWTPHGFKTSSYDDCWCHPNRHSTQGKNITVEKTNIIYLEWRKIRNISLDECQESKSIY